MLFRELRAALRKRGLTNGVFSEQLGIGQVAASHRFTGKVQWRLSEMYETMRILGEPYSEMLRYFPEGGMDASKKLDVLPYPSFTAKSVQ